MEQAGKGQHCDEIASGSWTHLLGTRSLAFPQIVIFIIDGYTNVTGVNIHQNQQLFCQSLLVYELSALAVPI
jgi:hypothetical protein